MTTTAINITQGVFDLIVLIIMIFAAIDDAKTRIVRPIFQISLLVVSVLHLAFEFIAYPNDLWNHGLNCLLAGVLMFGIYITFVLIFKTGIGGADTKVSSTMALYLGIWPSIIMAVAHSASAMIYVGYEKVVHKKHIASVPLMVFILVGYIVAKIVMWSITLATIA